MRSFGKTWSHQSHANDRRPSRHDLNHYTDRHGLNESAGVHSTWKTTYSLILFLLRGGEMLYIVIYFVLLYGARGRRHVDIYKHPRYSQGVRWAWCGTVCVSFLPEHHRCSVPPIATTTMAQSTCVLKAFHLPPLANGNQQP